MANYESMNYYQKLTFIFQNIQLVIAIIGIIGGILNICVFSRKALKSVSFSFYMKAISLCNIIASIYTIRKNLDTESIFFCKTDDYQAISVALWLINVISVDRMTTFVYSNNHRLQIFNKKWFKVAILLILIVCALIIIMPLKNEIPLVTGSTIQMCMSPDSGTILSYTILTIILFNIALNIKIIVFVIQSRKKISTTVENRQFVVNAIGLNFSCLACKSTFLICSFVITYFPMSGDLAKLIFTISLTISIFDNAFTFFINSLMNPTFYDEFLCMIRLRIQPSLP